MTNTEKLNPSEVAKKIEDTAEELLEKKNSAKKQIMLLDSQTATIEKLITKELHLKSFAEALSASGITVTYYILRKYLMENFPELYEKHYTKRSLFFKNKSDSAKPKPIKEIKKETQKGDVKQPKTEIDKEEKKRMDARESLNNLLNEKKATAKKIEQAEKDNLKDNGEYYE